MKKQIEADGPGWLGAMRANLDSWVGDARLAAYQALAARAQRRFCGHYVAVTGSCGKSTATWLAGELLAVGHRARSMRHPNNGKPMLKAYFPLREPVDYTVQEVSGDMPGAISVIARRMRIDAAVVTAVGADHRSNFTAGRLDVLDAIAAEKGNLVAALRPGGFACLNADDARVAGMAVRTRERIITYGLAAGAELRAHAVGATWPERLCFDLEVDGRRLPVRTRFFGTLLLPSVLAALAVVHGFRLDLEPAIARLATLEPLPHRLSVHRLPDGSDLVLDDHKAPLWSAERLVADLADTAPADLTFVLGSMSDLAHGRGRHYRRVLRSLSPLAAEVVAMADAAAYVEQVRQQGFGNVVALQRPEDLLQHLGTRRRGLVVIKSNRLTSDRRPLPDFVTREPTA